MKKLFFSLFALCALYSCNDSNTQEATSDAAPAVEEIVEVVVEESAIEVVIEDSADADFSDAEIVAEEE